MTEAEEQDTTTTQHDDKIGPSQKFVISRGFRDASQTAPVAESPPAGTQSERGGILIGVDGTARLFLELTADVDRTEVRPQAGWNAVLSSMPPGWTMRVLQAIWPDPHPRAQFRRMMENTWPVPSERHSTTPDRREAPHVPDGVSAVSAVSRAPAHDGKQLLFDELLLSLDEIPLPLMRRTIVELAVPLDALEDAFSFIDGTVANLAGYGVQAGLLGEDDVRNLVHGIFNPEVRM